MEHKKLYIAINQIIHRINKLELQNFCSCIPTCSSVLIVEVNKCHGETFLSLEKYFKDLNYTPYFLVNYSQVKQKSAKGLKSKVFYLSSENIKKCFQKDIIKKYNIIFFNSYNCYTSPDLPSIYQELKLQDTKSFCFLHHLDKFNSSNPCYPFSLCNLDSRFKYINPSYFPNTKIIPKHKKVNFITIGSLDKKRRNIDLLIDAVQKLNKNNIKNFTITIIGGDSLNIPNSIKHYFKIKGRVTYPRMYKELKKADFFLCLLDPKIKEHQRYLKTGTSGSFQLILGFMIPALIEESFASLHQLDKNNSIIYSNFYDAILEAIELPNNTYLKLRNNLNILKQKLYTESLNNLKLALGENQ